MSYIELDGKRIWCEVHGEGEPLVMLHPGMVDSRAFGPNLPVFAERFRVYLPERQGHGRTPDVDGPITFESMANDMIAVIDSQIGGPVRMLGYSDGAAVALLVAQRRPDLVDRLACVAGVFHHDHWLPEAKDPSADLPDFMAASYAEVSPDGGNHYPVVLRKLAEMHQRGPSLSVEDLHEIRTRTLVMIGDDDEVSVEHATQFYRSLPVSELAIVPGTSHGLLAEKPDVCNALLLNFLLEDPVETFAPIRRA